MKQTVEKRDIPYAPIDKLERAIEVGDWVRIVEIPPSVSSMPPETREVFRLALGKTFRVEEFDDYGQAELNLSKKVARWNTIWVEPEHLLLFRRKRKQKKQI